ncbi:hypothetical protein MCAP1_000829 [Malassezia caprae]|uniref:Guanine nucleotide-binding protein-like 3 N-terminal domain-containing protein n=1 Tax=Malassezia caprae TaxID=1381934 RepID=A0AAF0IVK9_9BASI|nr:hypothetical protein MCAP1_000829 [Malassezia caprae]
MVRVKKRASKRMTLKQRAKIHKKVQEHGRKQRREARRNPQRKSKKADPGIPNLFPYKEELLNEMEERRRIAAEQRMLAKEKRNEEDGDEDEDEEELVPEPAQATPLVRPPAPMLSKPLADVIAPGSEVKGVVYVLDARDPSCFRRTWLETQLRSKKSPKLTLALAKADLVPSEVLTGWVYDLRRAGLAVFPTSVRPGTEPAGVDALAEHLRSVSKGDIAVLGLEHVGKTDLAAALKDAMEGVQVYDTPSLVRSAAPMPDEDTDEELSRMETQAKLLWILMRNQGQVQRFKDPIALVCTLLPRVAHPVDLMMAYGTPAFGSFVPERATLADNLPDKEALREYEQQTDAKAMADTEEFLIGVARSVGRLKRLGVPDTAGAARLLLRDWAHDGLGYYAMPQSKAKAVQANGSSQEKELWADVEQLVHAMEVVRPRKEWRQAWASKEVRLKALEKAPYDEDALVFMPVLEDLEDEDDGEDEEDVQEDDDIEDMENLDEDDEEDLDDEDEEDLDDEDEEDLDDQDEEDLDDQDDKDLEDKEEEPVIPPSKKRTKAPITERARKLSRPTREAPPATRRSTNGSRPAQAPPKRRAPAPGEAYDINAYF